MVSVTVRVLILAFAVGVCIAGDFSDSKCKTDDPEKAMRELGQNYTKCLEQVKPGADPETAHHEGFTSIETEALGLCMNKLSEIISEDGVYSVQKVLNDIDARMTGTDEKVKKELKDGVKDCAEKKDPKEDCLEIMTCVHDVVIAVCELPTFDKEEEEQE